MTYGKYTNEPKARIEPKSQFLLDVEARQKGFSNHATYLAHCEAQEAAERKAKREAKRNKAEAAEKTVDFKAKRASRQK